MNEAEIRAELIDPVLKAADRVGELAQEKLPTLLEVKHSGISDAAASLGSIPEIREVFVEFQQYLYAR
jgi:type I restriction enzyme R subunit